MKDLNPKNEAKIKKHAEELKWLEEEMRKKVICEHGCYYNCLICHLEEK